MKVKIRIVRDTVFLGSVWFIGNVVDVDKKMADELVARGEAELVKPIDK